MHNSDYASRNPTQCINKEKCQICKFANEQEKIGDDCNKIRPISIEEISKGLSTMPFIQLKTWKSIQENDGVHTKLKHLIEIGQSPEKKKTKDDNTKLKLLHNLYCKGDLEIKEGVIMVKTAEGHFKGKAISIPYQMYPGLTQALHLRLQHPSKIQLTNLMQRFFYCPGYAQVINDVTDSCQQCLALKNLPKALIENTTSRVESFGSKFSVDIMERERQVIFVCRENLSQFTQLRLLEDQSAATCRRAILSLVVPLIADQGCCIRTDGAQSFVSLKIESEDRNSLLYKFKISIEVGRLNNPNKNAVAENCVKEVEKEILRYNPELKVISENDLIQIQKIINTRTRSRGLSAQEMMLKRNMTQNEDIGVVDKDLSKKQYDSRKERNEKLN